MKNIVALLGIGTALVAGCADDAQERTIQHRIPGNFDLVEVSGGNDNGPSLAPVEQYETVDLGPDQLQDFVEFDQSVIVVDTDGVALSNELAAEPARPAVAVGPPAVVQNNEQVGELTPLPAGTSDACECTTADCVTDWIDQNLGCNVCVLFTCGDRPFAAGCNACP